MVLFYKMKTKKGIKTKFSEEIRFRKTLFSALARKRKQAFFSLARLKIGNKLKRIFLVCPENNYQPRIYSANLLFSLLIGLVFLRLVLLPFYFYFPQSSFFAEIISGEIIEFLNSERMGFGLETLKQNSQLAQAAALKAQDMLNNDYFSHTSPEGITPWHWFETAGYDYSIAGENLAIGFLDSIEVHQAWNASGPHQQNLLDQRFKEIGVAVLTGDFKGNETTVVVQLFASPKQEISSPVAVVPSEINPKPEEHVLSLESGEETALTEEETVIAAGAEPETILPVLLGMESGIENKTEQSFGARLSQFFVKSYDSIIKDAIILTLVVLGAIFVLNLYIVLKSKFLKGAKALALKDLVLGILPAIGILILLSMTDKLLLIRFIPHRLRI